MFIFSLMSNLVIFLSILRVTSLNQRDRKSLFAIGSPSKGVNIKERLLGLFTSTSLLQCTHRCKQDAGCVEAVMGSARKCMLLGKRGDRKVSDNNQYNFSISSILRPLKLPGKYVS